MARERIFRSRASLCLAALVGAALASCGKTPREPRPAWRDEAERACLSSGAVKESAYIVRGPAIEGPGACGALSPFHVSALSDGKVGLTLPGSLAGQGHKAYAATLTCAMVPALESWMSGPVQAAAAAVYGQPVVEMHTLGSYSCRRMNNGTGTHMTSEHAFADAVDVSGFTLADGREVMVKSGWRGSPEDQDFLRSVFVGSCDIFHTVLGPGSDGHHEDHFHLDLMRHASSRHVCRPVLKYSPRAAQPLDAPTRPPVPPGQMQPEPEADDPYALDDTGPDNRPALAAARPSPPPVGAPPPRPVFAAAPAPRPPLDEPVPPPGSRRTAQDDRHPWEAPAFAPKGDRLDRSGAPPRPAAPAPAPAPLAGGGSSYGKDSSRVGAEPPAPPRPAYAALPQRPPAPISGPAAGSRQPPASLLPPGWSVGAQPTPRVPARGEPAQPAGSDDADE